MKLYKQGSREISTAGFPNAWLHHNGYVMITACPYEEAESVGGKWNNQEVIPTWWSLVYL